MIKKKVNPAVKEYMSELGKKGGKKSWEVRSKQIIEKAKRQKVVNQKPNEL